MELRKNTSSCHPLHRGFPLGKHSMKYVLAAFLLAGPAAAEAQNLQQAITLQVNNTSLAVVLKQISQASGYKINFNTEDLQGLTATLNTGGKKMTVADILNRLSADLPIRYRMEKDFITVRNRNRHGRNAASAVTSSTSPMNRCRASVSAWKVKKEETSPRSTENT